MNAAVRAAARVPLGVAEKAAEWRRNPAILKPVTSLGMNPDLTTAIALARAACEAWLNNVAINLDAIEPDSPGEKSFVSEIRKRARDESGRFERAFSMVAKPGCSHGKFPIQSAENDFFPLVFLVFQQTGLLRRVIAAEIKVYPRGPLVEIVVDRWRTLAVQCFLGSMAFQPVIGPDINALSLIGILFAPAFKTSAAGAVSLAFGALTLRTQVSSVKQRAIAAVHAIVGDALDDLLRLDKSAFGWGFIHCL